MLSGPGETGPRRASGGEGLLDHAVLLFFAYLDTQQKHLKAKDLDRFLAIGKLPKARKLRSLADKLASTSYRLRVTALANDATDPASATVMEFIPANGGMSPHLKSIVGSIRVANNPAKSSALSWFSMKPPPQIQCATGT